MRTRIVVFGCVLHRQTPHTPEIGVGTPEYEKPPPSNSQVGVFFVCQLVCGHEYDHGCGAEPEPPTDHPLYGVRDRYLKPFT